MPTDPRRRRSLLAVLVLVCLLLITLDFRQGDEGLLAGLQRQAMAAFSPVQHAVSRVVRPVGELAADVVQLTQLRAENRRLREELDALRARQVSLADLERENDELRRLVGMAERYAFATSAARVIAQPPGAFRWSVLIDVGLEQGVVEGMAVVDAEGLAGRVVAASSDYARVQLAVSPNARYSVRIAETGQQGLLSGRGSRPMELRILEDPDTPVPAGAEIVTRAFQGTSIPDGIPVGTVQDTGAASTGRTQLLPVTPRVDWRRLDLVLVVLDAPAIPEQDELDLAPEDGAEADETGTEGAEDEPGSGDDVGFGDGIFGLGREGLGREVGLGNQVRAGLGAGVVALGTDPEAAGEQAPRSGPGRA